MDFQDKGMTHAATSGNRGEKLDAANAVPPPGSVPSTTTAMPATVRLLLFAAAREAAGTRQVELTATTVDDVMSQARVRFGAAFGAVLDRSRVWVNGEPSLPSTPLVEGDEVAVLPPVSGG